MKYRIVKLMYIFVTIAIISTTIVSLNNQVSAVESSSVITDEVKVYNVRDFGAVGDGIADDTAAFTNAINTADGDIVLVPEGTYAVNYCNIVKGRAINLQGVDNPSIIRTKAPLGNYDASIFKFNDVPSAYISGITFDSQRDKFLKEATTTKDIFGNTIEKTTYQEWIDTACVYFYYGGKNITIENCAFMNCSREAIYCSRGYYNNVQIRNNYLTNTSANFWLRKSSMDGFIWENNVANGCRTMNVEFDLENEENGERMYAKDITIRNNKFYNTMKCGVFLTNTSDVLIENNEYTYRDRLYEHGRKSSDVMQPYFVWARANVVDQLSNSNVVIRNNSGKSVNPVLFHAHARADRENVVFHHKNIQVLNNSFEVDSVFARTEFIDNVVVEGNEIFGSNVQILSQAYCENTSVDGGNKVNNIPAMSLNYNKLTLVENESFKLKMTPNPYVNLGAFKWKSSNESVATVDSNGKITAVKAGKTEISVESDSGVKAICAVMVRDKSAPDVCKVVFVDYNNEIIKSVEVNFGDPAVAPDVPFRLGYEFTGWDANFSCVTSDMTVHAQYKQLVMGDADKNGVLNVSDATCIQKHIAGYLDEQGDLLIDEKDENEFYVSDVNGDGVINIRDALQIQKALTGII